MLIDFFYDECKGAGAYFPAFLQSCDQGTCKEKPNKYSTKHKCQDEFYFAAFPRRLFRLRYLS